MAESEQFRRWCGIENAKVIAKVDRLMWPRNIKVEVKVNGEWVEQ
jgi:hypothetical protein